jgi:hypothetical protein
VTFLSSLFNVNEIDDAIVTGHFTPTLWLDVFVRAETDPFQEP